MAGATPSRLTPLADSPTYATYSPTSPLERPLLRAPHLAIGSPSYGSRWDFWNARGITPNLKLPVPASCSMRVLLLTFLLVGLGFSGCLDSDTPDPADSLVDNALQPFVNPVVLSGDGHEHGDLSAHTLSNNVDLIGHNPLGANGPPGRIGEIDVAGGYAFVTLFDYGFAIVDLADPANPELVSLTETVAPESLVLGKYTADLKVDSTGDWVFLGMELSATPGLLIYDTRDKQNPVLAGFWPVPGLLAGCHMVEYAIIDEQEYLFCAPLDNAIYVGQLLPEVNGVREVLTVARWTPATTKYVGQEVNLLQENPSGWPTHFVSGHQDMTYQEDPLTGTPMLMVSFWNLGVRFVDVSIPEVPIEIGSWMGEGATKYDGVLHTSMSWKHETPGGDRRITATIPEGANPPALFILDTTDYSAPELLAEWTALEDFEGESGSFSMHNFQFVDGKLYLAMYHGGLWVLDVDSDANLAAPEPVGSYMPHEPRMDGANYSVGAWDVVVWNGYMITGDAHGGFYILHHNADPAGKETHTSFA